jgi:integral membrane protein
MPSGLRPADIPRLRTAVKVYKVSSIITGTFLLSVVLMMVLRYGFGVDIALSTQYGFDLLPKETIERGGLINVSLILLTAHGWLYVLYLGCDFVMWRLARYSFLRFLFVALGGVIPFLSFFLERLVPRDIERRIASAETAATVAA